VEGTSEREGIEEGEETGVKLTAKQIDKREFEIKQAYQNGKLRPSDVAKLKAAGFDFSIRARVQSVKEWVPIAEKLAEEHGGILPHKGWLGSNGYCGLIQALQKYPELFAHLDKDNQFGRTVDEWVSVAEQLAEKHNGALPRGIWLMENGYKSLHSAIRHNSEKFSHIKTEFISHTPHEWVKIAEKLAEDNGGILPCNSWLRNNRYSGLPSVIYRCPELFKHIKQENKSGRTPEQWVEFAEKLAKENQGILPCAKWLSINGFSGMYDAIRRRPELFRHIKMSYNPKGLSSVDGLIVEGKAA
jgi:hypothetical protein